MVENLCKLSKKAAHIKTKTYILKVFLLFLYVFVLHFTAKVN